MLQPAFFIIFRCYINQPGRIFARVSASTRFIGVFHHSSHTEPYAPKTIPFRLQLKGDFISLKEVAYGIFGGSGPFNKCQ